MPNGEAEVSEVTALVPAEPFNMGRYLDATANDTAIHAQQQLVIAYDRAVRALVGPNDVQKAQGKEFKKKSAWRKLARYFNISTQIIREESHREPDGHLVSTVVVRAIAPWGQYAEGIAKCSTREARFRNDVSKADHDCPATAQTRATNRAVSDLIAAGEVSAEEMEFGEIPHAPASHTPAAPAPAAQPTAAVGAPPAARPYAPSEKQINYYRKLCDSPVFTAVERTRALDWLTKATRQTIKDQIDWLKTQVETRPKPDGPVLANSKPVPTEGYDAMPEALRGDAKDDDLPF